MQRSPFWSYFRLNMRFSLFEKVVLANSLMLVVEALAGLWVTSHNLEAHHYLIDTSFIVVATLLSLTINALLLRASFRPLFSLLRTIRAVSAGATQERAIALPLDSEIGELAHAFNSMLDRLEEARRERAMLILQAQEEERHRLALELHDESSQNLTALLIHTEVLNQTLQALPHDVISAQAREKMFTGLSSLAEIAQATLENVRLLAQQLRPRVLDDLGLYAAFRWLAEDSRERLHVTVELHTEGIDTSAVRQHCSTPHEIVLFRIAQESLTNVARHAHTQHVFVSLVHDTTHFRLYIRDNGCGYDTSKPHVGLGTLSMHERATLLGGTLTLHSQPGKGTTVEAIIPCTKEAAHA
ncbi:MAG: sensor histidine kinase [Ktedonobacteraceae bacterium]|nr:sensor histidine kinase [Ktedonobacteraceae bacterium]